MHSDSKKRRSFLALLFDAGDLRRTPLAYIHIVLKHDYSKNYI